MVSLARVRSFAPTLVFGGHGEPIHDFEELFNRYLKLIRERQVTVIGSIPKSGATAWEISRTMFPDADDVHRFLAVSEAAAHLDYAQSEGKLGAHRGHASRRRAALRRRPNSLHRSRDGADVFQSTHRFDARRFDN